MVSPHSHRSVVGSISAAEAVKLLQEPLSSLQPVQHLQHPVLVKTEAPQHGELLCPHNRGELIL